MKRVNRWRSCLHPQNCLLQTFLLALGVSFIACPAQSLPVELVPHNAIDLVEAAGDERQEAGGRRQKAEGQGNKGQRDKGQRDKGDGGAEDTREAEVRGIQTLSFTPDSRLPTPDSQLPFDLDPQLIESSPVLQRWLQQVPDVLADIKHDPSFRTRLHWGYVQFPSSKQAGGLTVGIEDLFVGRSGLTVSADYQTAFNSSRAAWGSDLRYYVRPLGSVINLAPVIGYRHLETTRYSVDGVHVGLRLLLVPSRTGAADLALTQSWVAPGDANEVGLTTLSFGYALTHNLRLSTDLQKQNSRFRSDSRVGIGLEWMF